MIEALALAAMALVAGMTGMTFWAVKRSFSASDEARAASKIAADLLLENVALVNTRAEMQHAIDELTHEATRLRRALDIAEDDTPPLITTETAGATIRQSLNAMRAAGQATPTPTAVSLPALPPRAAPGSVTGGIVLPTGAPAPGGASAGRPGGAGVHVPPADPAKRPR